ncbi:hypothetical protein IFVP203_C2190075 [Vibrio parahaemolyticus]
MILFSIHKRKQHPHLKNAHLVAVRHVASILPWKTIRALLTDPVRLYYCSLKGLTAASGQLVHLRPRNSRNSTNL